jgi:polyhydroxyalkanoate synthesis regulator phasin
MATDWNEQASQMFKLWSDGQRAWLESLSRLPTGNVASPSGVDPAPAQRLRDAWTESVDQWMKAWTAISHDAVPFASSPESLRKLLDPTAWAKPLPGSFDFGFERLIEGPTFASQPELQIKALKLQQLAQRRAQDSANYHNVVLAAWRQAVERFMKQLTDPNAESIGTFRNMIDRWVKVANDTLIEVHRSPEFLEAQQRVTRSTTEYRLLEREIAEAYCEAGHVPTRSEMDEVQQSVVELRREVRDLRRQLKANGGTQA